MKYLSLIVSQVLVITFSITSCKQTSSHKDDLIYYTTIALQMKNIAPRVQDFWLQMQQGVLTARQNGDGKLDKPSFDSLKNSYAAILNGLDSEIAIINMLKETDEELNFKQAVLFHLTEIKSLNQALIPQCLRLYEIGIGKINDRQKEALQTFVTKGQELQLKSGDIQHMSLVYQRKHNISNEELKKFGL